MVSLQKRLFELETFAAHKEQRQDVAEVDALRFDSALQAREAINQHLVVDRQPAGLAGGRDTAGPEAKRAGRRALPGLAAVVLALQAALVFHQHGVEPLAWLEF